MNRSISSALAALACLLFASMPVLAASIFTCTDKDGNKLTADRLIAVCKDREQIEHNADGSIKRVHPPQPTDDERAEKDRRDRKDAEDREARKAAERSDLNLRRRFPDESAHHRAREAELETHRQAIDAFNQRLKELGAQHKRLMEEAEFYQGRTIPPMLKQKIDDNEADTEAQKVGIARRQSEIQHVNRLYDAELERLRRTQRQ